ncbi:3-isopropylmalate dehydrogenase [Staphylococcus epidermidis]|uniref:3-isopropylmalate dehydrogenase n=1 Tax=Staphylococcus epidermidis TaxID=1282 RepID=UPI00138ADC20|nr:3-isopropylmalate dehydrogenase [Staphylococcus epidermidis]MBF2233809.1 3-isopropylmalate dehydrogenase [Staphylococcus epidermidis]MBG3871921.1 3-isopropylmalate dehydrogenase [Staphylococcus epidermidis]MCH9582885.1 3-isopropylmalate dehydrogenase [Staphylococcus epidermidis]WHI82212.1 3-isopropylmalate dehydrogenase [Staphylococcus epidermidis]
MSYKIVALPGDGIGPEILSGTLELLKLISEKYHFEYHLESHHFGGISIDNYGTPLTNEALQSCKNADAILLGAIGGPKWTDPNNRPEHGLLKLRKSLNLFANIRPTFVTKGASHLSPLKQDIVEGTDLVIVRELTSGIYFGEPSYVKKNEALDSLKYSSQEIKRIVRIAFNLANRRRKKLTSVDKENVLSSSKLWRQIVNDVKKNFPEVEVNHMLVDACSMHLITQPTQFDVIVTENLFGDILSDEASVIPGSLGLSPSASFGQTGTRLYEPIHGSAPDIANEDKANPFGMVLSLALCLRESLNQIDAANELESIVYSFIQSNKTTADLGGQYRTSEIFKLLKEKYL